jgi:hypothetical protein
MAVRAGVEADMFVPRPGVTQVIALAIPAGSQRTVDESGHGRGVRAGRGSNAG